MEEIYKSIILVATILSLPSYGNDWLDRRPTNGISSKDVITDYNDALTARTGTYDSIQGNSNNTSYYGARMFYYGDVRAEDTQVKTQGTYSSSCYEICYTVDDAPNVWNIPYSVVHHVGRLIQAINGKKVTDATEAQIDKIYLEALVVRALAHFDLVKIYGMLYTTDNGASLDVPVILKPLERNDLPSRNTVVEACIQVIRGLTDAVSSGYLAKDKAQGYIDKWATKALLARVYLTKGDNEGAFRAAEGVITNSPYKFWTNEEYVNAWYKNNGAHTSEMIFEAINASNDDWTGRSDIAYLPNENGYTDVIVTKNFIAMLSRDPKNVCIGMVLPARYDKDLKGEYGDARIFINKFPADRDDVSEMCLNNLPLLRLSEAHLSAAEAAAKPEGHQGKAVKYLNEIILRANPKAKAASEADATVEGIILERRREMIGEGQCYFDTLCNNETIVHYKDEVDKGYHYSLIEEPQNFDRTYFRTVFPTLADETNVDSSLRAQQNLGH